MHKTDSHSLPDHGTPGNLLDDLERRQDDVIAQLDDLDSKLADVLKGLEPEPDDSPSAESEAAEQSETSGGEYFA